MPQTVIKKFVELVCLVVNGKRAESDASVSVLLRGGVGQHNDFCCGSLRLQLGQYAEARASLQEQVKHSQAPRPVMGVEPLNGLHFGLSSPDDLCITNVVDCITNRLTKCCIVFDKENWKGHGLNVRGLSRQPVRRRRTSWQALAYNF